METAHELWQAFLKAHPEARSGKRSLEEINQKMAAFVKRLNELPNPDFEGLSPAQMNFVLHDPFHPQCVIRPKAPFPDAVLDRVPLFGLMEMVYAELEAKGQIKLTPKGNFPMDLCRRLYERKLLTQGDIEEGYTKRITEDNVVFIHVLKACLSIGGLVKKRNNAFSLTKAGEKALSQGRSAAFVQLLRDFTTRFYWAYLDEAGAGEVGQTGWAFSLLLLHRHGKDWQPAGFYAEKYGRAFPLLNEPVRSLTFDHIIPFKDVYQWRFFHKFASWFGLAELDVRKEKGVYPYPLWVRSTPLLDDLFAFSL